MLAETNKLEYISLKPERALIADEAESMAELLTDELQEFAEASGWPLHLCEALAVQSDHKGKFVIVFPEKLTDEIYNLEYSSPPHSVIRRFKLRINYFINKAVNPGFLEDLVEAMVEF